MRAMPGGICKQVGGAMEKLENRGAVLLQGQGWPAVPQTLPCHPQRGSCGSPKGFLSKLHLSA